LRDRFQLSKSGQASALGRDTLAGVPVNPHDEKQEERRMPANLCRDSELMDLALAVRLVTLPHLNVAFFNVAFRDSPKKAFALP
jgi:hypothetical protein